MEPEPTANNKKLAATIGLIIIVAAIIIAVAIFSPKNSSDTATTATPTPSSATLDANTASPSPTAAAAYKDGTYSSTGDYESPGGVKTLSLSVIIKDGAVTDSTVTTTGKNPTGKKFQTQFIEGYKSFITGKNVNDIELSKVSGSSLTPEGFNNALAKIKTQAKA